MESASLSSSASSFGFDPDLATAASALTLNATNLYELGVSEHQAMNVSWGLPMAVVTGCCYAVAANVASYVATQAERTGKSPPRTTTLLTDIAALAGYVVGGMIITVAYASGAAVPVVNATMVATNLLVNMVLQIVLGITYYNKEMRVGTMIFVVAVFQLATIGPAERGDVDIVEKFTAPLALGWTLALVIMLAVSSVLVVTTYDAPAESMHKICAWAISISVMGTATDNGASVFGMLRGVALASMMAVYFFMAGALLLLSAKAPAVCEASIYVPVQLCTQMVFNMATGFLVWEDQTRVHNPSAYLATFVICLMSVYSSSSGVDIMASGSVKLYAYTANFDRSHFGQSVIAVLNSWKRLEVDNSEEARAAASEALRTMLFNGSARGAFTDISLVQLAVALSGEASEYKATAQVVHWMENTPFFRKYTSGHPEFSEALRRSLSGDETLKLAHIQHGSQMDLDEDDQETNSDWSSSDADDGFKELMKP